MQHSEIFLNASGEGLNIWFILQQTEYWYRKHSQSLLQWMTVSVQLLGHVQLFATPWTAAPQTFLVHHQLPELAQTHVHWVSSAIQPSHPLLSPSPPAPNPSQHQSLFQRLNSSHERPKYWSFSFSISPSSEYSGLISFRIDWLSLLAVQGTLFFFFFFLSFFIFLKILFYF